MSEQEIVHLAQTTIHSIDVVHTLNEAGVTDVKAAEHLLTSTKDSRWVYEMAGLIRQYGIAGEAFIPAQVNHH